MLQGIYSLLLFAAPLVLSVFGSGVFFLFVFATAGLPGSVFGEATRAFFGSLEGMGPSALKLMGAMAGAFVVFAMNPSRAGARPSRFAPHAFFLFFCVLAVAWSSSFVFGFRMLAKVAAPFLFMVGIYTSPRQRLSATALEKAAMVSCWGLLIYGFAGFFASHAGFVTSRLHLAGYLTAPHVSPAPFSFHMACGALITLAAYLSGKGKKYLGFFMVFTLAVFWANTRISMAGIIVASSVCFFLLSRNRAAKVLVPLLLVIAFTTAVFTVDRLSSRFFKQPDEMSLSSIVSSPGSLASKVPLSGRGKAWEAAIDRFFVDSPMIGSGLGATQDWFYGNNSNRVGVLHSEYLRLLCETGVFGILLFLVVVVYYVAALLRVFARAGELEGPEAADLKKYAALGLSMLVLYLVTMATDNSIDYVFYIGLYAFGFVALAFRHSDIDAQAAEPARTRDRPWLATARRAGLLEDGA